MNGTTSTRSIRNCIRQCAFCSRTFSKTEHLQRHVRSHTKEKPFQCQHCGRKYGRGDSLVRHIKDQHRDDDAISSESSVVQTAPVPRILLNQDGEQDTTMARTDPTVTDISSLTMPLDPLLSQNTHDDTNALPADPSSMFPQDLLPDQDINLGYSDWLTHENFGGLMHTWPFVFDENDVPPPTNATIIAESKPLADLQGSWYTHFQDENQTQSGYVTPLPRHNEIDDNYRQSLHLRLQVRSVDQSLPSVEYLNLCVRSYFQRFHPIFPVVHAATFRPLKTNSVLLLSICSVGSLLTGHPSAFQRGVQLFERLHKAILAQWEKLVVRGPEAALATVQASLIGQTFGLLSGQAKHLAIVDAFHGTVISLARRNKVFQTQHLDISTPAQQELDASWRIWAQNEEKIRVALGLHIHDAEIASLLHHETLLPSVLRISQTANDALFSATSAQEWFSLYKVHRTQHWTSLQSSTLGLTLIDRLRNCVSTALECSDFSIYATLNCVCSEIIEARMNQPLSTTLTDDLQECLVSFYERHLHGPTVDTARSGGRILWHYLFILLHSDLDLLEKSTGRDGPKLSPTDSLAIQGWANSAAAMRCAAHAIMIKRSLESFPLNSEPAIHVPRCVFSAIISLFCYTKYGNDATGSFENFPEMLLVDATVPCLQRQGRGNWSTDIKMGTLYGLVDQLKRIGHWEISRTFASIADVLLQAESS